VAMLEDLGHAVLSAGSGAQALEIVPSRARVDVVITDVSMPAMSGLQLAAELHRFDPDLPILLATGYAQRLDVAGSGLPMIPKPFDQAALAGALADCLDRRKVSRRAVLSRSE